MQKLKFSLVPAALSVALCAPAFAAPHAQSALECGIAADMAIVAHSLARESIEQDRASAIMNRIYDVSGSDRGKEMMAEIIKAAYGKTAAEPSAAAGGGSGKKFAEELFSTCMQTGGDLDSVLGKKV